MKTMINVALPKGRLGEKVYAMFENAGYECPSIKENNRKLIFENEEKGIRYFWVKPSDVSIYVERGAADIGVAGKDILLEYSPDVYELLDLKIGKCRMAVAGKKDFSVITLEKDMMNEEKGFGRKLLQVLERHDVSFEHLPTGIDTMSVVVNSHTLEGKEDDVISDLMETVCPDVVNIDKDIALVAVVGRGMKNAKGTSAALFTCLANSNINVKMIDQGSSEINIIVGVDNKDFESAICAIYDGFLKAGMI